MPRRYAPSTLALLALACACDCGAPPSYVGPASEAGADSSVSVSKACGDLAMAECAGLATCSITLMQMRYGAVATCETRLAASCVNALGAPSTGNSAARSEACAGSYSTWSCENYLGDRTLSPACAQVTGALALGAACAFAAQCATGFCAIPPGVSCGVCATPATAGDSCADVTSCGQGLVCFPGSRVCGVAGALGVSCSESAPCAAHLSCVGAGHGVSGACQAAVALVGAACDPTLETGPGCDFDLGLACNGQTKLCAPLTISSAGGPCDTLNHQYATCAESGTCTTGEAGAAGSCVAAAADGQACGTTPAGPACTPPARCILASAGDTMGTCQLDDAAACK